MIVDRKDVFDTMKSMIADATNKVVNDKKASIEDIRYLQGYIYGLEMLSLNLKRLSKKGDEL